MSNIPSYLERRQYVIEAAEQIIEAHQQAQQAERLEQAIWTDAAVYGLSDCRVWEFLKTAQSLDAWRWAVNGKVTQ